MKMYFKKLYRQQRRKLSRQLTLHELKNLFKNSGLESSESFMLHSSMMRMSKIEYGIEGIVSTLLEVSPNVTILAPTFNDYSKVNEPEYIYDVHCSSSDLGALSEYIRKMDRAKRSLHPTHNVAAVGPLASRFTANHHYDDRPFCKNSPYYKNMFNNGKILLLGVNLNSMTSFHLYEDFLPADFGLDIYEEDQRNFLVKDGPSSTTTYNGFVHSLEKAFSRDVERMRHKYIEAGALKEISLPFGKITVVCPYTMTLVNLTSLQNGKTAYGDTSLSVEQKTILAAAIERFLELKN